MNESVKTIVLRIGDPNRIDPEIAVKAVASLLGNENIRAVLVGDEYVIRYYSERSAHGNKLQRFAGNSPAANDAILLQPVEALPFGAGVLFSSVGHSSAFDIARQNKADPAAMRALRLIRNGPADARRQPSAGAA